MASLFTDAEKAEFSALLVDVADTFEREITVYKSPEKTMVFTEEGWNRFSENDQNDLNNPTNTYQRFTIQARILYAKQMKEELLTPYVGGALDEAQLKLASSNGMVRIKVGPTGYAIMKEVKELEFDGFRFSIASPERPHGLFTPQYYTFYLTLIK
jgi:hypothetical protein